MFELIYQHCKKNACGSSLITFTLRILVMFVGMNWNDRLIFSRIERQTMIVSIDGVLLPSRRTLTTKDENIT